MTTYIRTDKALTGPFARFVPSVPTGAGGPDLVWISKGLTPGQTLTTWTDARMGAAATSSSSGTVTATENGMTAVLAKTADAKISIPAMSGGDFTLVMVVDRVSPYNALAEIGGMRLVTTPSAWAWSKVPNGNGVTEVSMAGAEINFPSIVIARASGTSSSLQVRTLKAGAGTLSASATGTGVSGFVGRTSDYASGTAIYHVAVYKRRLTDAEVADVYKTLKATYSFVKD